MIDAERLYTPTAVRTLLQVRRERILGWLESGQLQGIRLGQTPSGRTTWRIAGSELLRFLNKGLRAGVTATENLATLQDSRTCRKPVRRVSLRHLRDV